MKFKGNRIAIIPDEKITATKAGLSIPQGSEEKQQTGTIHAVGTQDVFGKPLDPDFVKGAKVIFHKHGGVPVRDGDLELLVIKSEEIIAVTSESKPMEMPCGVINTGNEDEL